MAEKKKAVKAKAKAVDSEDNLDEEPAAGGVESVSDEDLEDGDIPGVGDDEEIQSPNLEHDVQAEDAGELNLEMEEPAKTDLPRANVLPKVINNICERCGVPIHGDWVYDQKNAKGWRAAKPGDDPSKITKCKHYSRVDLICGYCRNPEMGKQRTIFVYSLPEKPNVLITCCNDLKCREKHMKRFSSSDFSASTATLTAN